MSKIRELVAQRANWSSNILQALLLLITVREQAFHHTRVKMTVVLISLLHVQLTKILFNAITYLTKTTCHTIH